MLFAGCIFSPVWDGWRFKINILYDLKSPNFVFLFTIWVCRDKNAFYILLIFNAAEMFLSRGEIQTMQKSFAAVDLECMISCHTHSVLVLKGLSVSLTADWFHDLSHLFLGY